LANRDASQIHAVISWSGRIWEIVDLSRNGTFVDGTRLLANVRSPLLQGQVIRFAMGGDAEWRVIDLAAPCPMLIPSSSAGRPIVLNGIQLLPDELCPQASIYLSAAGQWLFDDPQGIRVLKDGDAIELEGAGWRLMLPPPAGGITDVQEFPAQAPLAPTFDFRVSQNEEHIWLSVDCGGEQIDFGERAHHYSLLTLARRRFADHQRGFDEPSQGWVGVDQLSKMLGIDPSHLNIQLFRARSQIMREQRDSGQLPDVIERRRGEVRLRSCAFKITRGMQLEAYFDACGSAPSSVLLPA
jgi:hypothetical protein